jgi:hypothetical protein
MAACIWWACDVSQQNFSSRIKRRGVSEGAAEGEADAMGESRERELCPRVRFPSEGAQAGGTSIIASGMEGGDVQASGKRYGGMRRRQSGRDTQASRPKSVNRSVAPMLPARMASTSMQPARLCLAVTHADSAGQPETLWCALSTLAPQSGHAGETLYL